MVLHGRLCGRVGRRRTHIEGEGSRLSAGPLFFVLAVVCSRRLVLFTWSVPGVRWFCLLRGRVVSGRVLRWNRASAAWPAAAETSGSGAGPAVLRMVPPVAPPTATPIGAGGGEGQRLCGHRTGQQMQPGLDGR